MGVSFKVSKIGKRYASKPIADQAECSPRESPKKISHAFNGPGLVNSGISEAANHFAGSKASEFSEHDVSFTMNLLPNGYFVGKPSEVENFRSLLQDVKSLHPYNRASKPFFSAIETGWLPGDILDDIPCKYINGGVICEVRDYRKCQLEQGTISSIDPVPNVNRIRLRMSLENVVKDIPLIADESWTYSDLMEVESRILKALQPKLDLAPVPKLYRLCTDPTVIKLNVDVGRKRRVLPNTEVTVTSNNQTHGKKICIDGAPEIAKYAGDSGTLLSNSAMQRVHESVSSQQLSSAIGMPRPNISLHEAARTSLAVAGHTKFQPGVNHAGVMQDHGLSPSNYVGATGGIPLPQSMVGSYTDTANANFSLHGRREAQDPQSTSMTGLNRPRQAVAGLDSFSGQEMQWKSQTAHPQIDAKGFLYSNAGVPRFSHMNQEAVASMYFNQQAMRYGPKEEQIESDKFDKQIDPATTTDSSLDQQQLRVQQQAQQSSIRSNTPIAQLHNSRVLAEKDSRKDEILQKRKALPSPRVSSGPMVQSPISSKSGELSSGSIGGQYSAIDRIHANSNTAVGAHSIVSSPTDSVHRQTQPSASLKRKANSVPKTQAMSGIASPASVSNFNAPMNASSPSIGTSSMIDQMLMDRFAKIEMATQRWHINARKNKVEKYPTRKPLTYSCQQMKVSLSNSLNSEDFTDPVDTLSRSIRGGNINACKTRLITFIRPERSYQLVPGRTSSKLIMSEKPFDGTVAVQFGDTDDSELPTSLECCLTLPTTHFADLLAAQFCSLMERDGHHKAEDQVFLARTPVSRMGSVGSSLPQGRASENVTSGGKLADLSPAQLSTAAVPSNNSGIPPLNSHNLSNNTGMLGPGSGIPARNQQFEQSLFQQQQQQLQQHQLQQQQLQQQQQKQQQQQQQLQQMQGPQSQLQQQQLPLPRIQRSSPALSSNTLSHLIGQNSNIQMGANPIGTNKPGHIQLQMQQHNQLPTKVMMGLNAAMGMGNMGNNMVGIAGLGNVMGMGGVRGLSSPIGSLPGLGSVNSNQMLPTSASNFSTGIRPTSMSSAQAAAVATKLRMTQQNRAGIYGSHPGIANLTGNSSQVLGTSANLSMLSQALNRPNMSNMQANAALASMGPPKISGSNFYLSQQQQLQLPPQRSQQQQLQQHSPQLQQQQQQISSPLQQSQVTSPSMAGSPTLMQQQQMNQMSPQQFNGSISGALPASPQLGSQTHGSIGSIAGSPMEQLQGANKGGSSNI
ncbi:hypothetical protein KSP39_PZI003252 [Platanthera zijinensis]|uniref:Uncharacterized protein n=1 Tax=Platanthera zijinensis TaxID=2320716 RepID=A0AAP0BXK2_9ASPA